LKVSGDDKVGDYERSVFNLYINDNATAGGDTLYLHCPGALQPAFICQFSISSRLSNATSSRSVFFPRYYYVFPNGYFK
jgi:hypothetical protein